MTPPRLPPVDLNRRIDESDGWMVVGSPEGAFAAQVFTRWNVTRLTVHSSHQPSPTTMPPERSLGEALMTEAYRPVTGVWALPDGYLAEDSWRTGGATWALSDLVQDDFPAEFSYTRPSPPEDSEHRFWPRTAWWLDVDPEHHLGGLRNTWLFDPPMRTVVHIVNAVGGYRVTGHTLDPFAETDSTGSGPSAIGFWAAVMAQRLGLGHRDPSHPLVRIPPLYWPRRRADRAHPREKMPVWWLPGQTPRQLSEIPAYVEHMQALARPEPEPEQAAKHDGPTGLWSWLRGNR